MNNLQSYEEYLKESISDTDVETLKKDIQQLQVFVKPDEIIFQKMDSNFSDIEMQAIMAFAKKKGLPLHGHVMLGQDPDKNASMMIYGVGNLQNPHLFNVQHQVWYVDEKPNPFYN